MGESNLVSLKPLPSAGSNAFVTGPPRAAWFLYGRYAKREEGRVGEPKPSGEVQLQQIQIYSFLFNIIKDFENILPEKVRF